MAKKDIPATKIRLEVVDINMASNSVLLEGFEGDLKFMLMIDADLDKKMVVEAVVGDKWDVTLKNTIKLVAKKNKAGAVTVGQMKGNVCTGTGAAVLKKDVFKVSVNPRRSFHSFTMKTKCPDCGKEIAVNGGYSSKPYTVRKHNV